MSTTWNETIHEQHYISNWLPISYSNSTTNVPHIWSTAAAANNRNKRIRFAEMMQFYQNSMAGRIEFFARSWHPVLMWKSFTLSTAGNACRGLKRGRRKSTKLSASHWCAELAAALKIISSQLNVFFSHFLTFLSRFFFFVVTLLYFVFIFCNR